MPEQPKYRSNGHDNILLKKPRENVGAKQKRQNSQNAQIHWRPRFPNDFCSFRQKHIHAYLAAFSKEQRQ